MQPLVFLVFHNLPSLYPPSFRRNDFSYLFHLFLPVLLPTRARDQRLKCANNSNVAHFLILSSKSSRHDMTQQILKNSWWRNVWFCVEYYATLCNFPLKQTVAVETATN